MQHMENGEAILSATLHHHVWRLLIEHGVATFGTNPVLVREPRAYAHRTSAVRAGQALRDAGRCDAFEVRQCSEIHTLDQLLDLKQAEEKAESPQPSS